MSNAHGICLWPEARERGDTGMTRTPKVQDLCGHSAGVEGPQAQRLDRSRTGAAGREVACRACRPWTRLPDNDTGDSENAEL